jgi:hypothetical protein
MSLRMILQLAQCHVQVGRCSAEQKQAGECVYHCCVVQAVCCLPAGFLQSGGVAVCLWDRLIQLGW